VVTPLISIIIPAYNAARHLPGTLARATMSPSIGVVRQLCQRFNDGWIFER
jgi:phosphoribosylcarboxyaminoimidazole (NCAIR) mutase